MADAVQSARQNNFVHIMINGHADTTGTNRYNQKLSEQRAAAVKTQMVQLGNSGSRRNLHRGQELFASAAGPDRVPMFAEPQNRRGHRSRQLTGPGLRRP